MKVSADSMSNQVADNPIMIFGSMSTDCLGNIIQMISRTCGLESLKETLSGHIHQLTCLR